ncbi:MAG: helix-turn-helix domain-containing protein [Candidatus Eremiobacteraeota bacterium]|nr:helix-turn-helix domain-containing protein [Candidatus Eremiobacteraeota bacterium]
MRRVIVFVPDRVELFDLAGPVQVFHEAIAAGADYRLEYVSTQDTIATEQSLAIARLLPLPHDTGPNDTIVIPGSAAMREAACMHPSKIADVTAWLRSSFGNGARIASVCVGAFVLGASGLLDDRHATTHWKFTDALREAFPRARVAGNRLYVFDGLIATSAGIASGVDLALAIVERDAGARVAAIVAREMVVGIRRCGAQDQLNAYFERRDHVYPEVHAAQDWLVEHPGESFTIESLAHVAGVSSRTLTRRFRLATGATVKAYVTSLRLEQARALLRDKALTIDAVAERCGFADGRQLRRLWRTAYGVAPSDARGG